MITWMQKHKKWLVITIWIATIAFIGAGFVGWGSYDYNKSNSNIAIVGDKTIEIKDLQTEYSNLYSQYQQMLGDQFNNEMAKQLDLENIAFNNIVQKFLLLNLAEDYGVMATKEEIAKELVKIPAFIINNKFDKATYVKVLKQNRTNPTDFEAQIKRDLTIQKLTKIFSSNTNNNTIENLSKILFSSDKVSVNVLKLDDININFTQDDIKNYWEKNKEKYKSITKYKINIEQITLGEDAKKTKKVALKKYLSLKKATSSFNQTLLIDENTEFIGKENLNKIFKSKVGTLLKPIKTNDKYIIVQLIQIIQPKVLDFDIVKQIVQKDYSIVQKRTKLIAKRNDIMQNFTGNDLGYISKDKQILIADLNADETTKLMQSIFSSTSAVNFIELANKTVVYKIFDTKLGVYDKSKDFGLKENINKMQNQVILASIIQNLKNRYEIQSNLKVK